ncbi:MAG: glucosyl-3-phosphoglycerate synthase [Acidimicrobiia bacterium]
MPFFVAPANHRDFDPGELAQAKRAQGSTISVCIPARDEAATIGAIVGSVRGSLVERHGLVDEVVVLDDGSADRTSDVARAAGARVEAVGEILAETGPGTGKGNVLWKSLAASGGDIICWVDGDLRNFEPHFVTGLVGPLLSDPTLAFVKGCYDRPFDGDPRGGGRVTELVARPIISHLFPDLARIVQPLGGEYAGRRSVLEAVPFVEGWGVELALLVDISRRFGIASIAQVDLGVREHRNRSLPELAPQAMAILVTALRRAGLDRSDTATEELVRFDGFAMERTSVELRERPPMLEVPAYRAKLGRELSA